MTNVQLNRRFRSVALGLLLLAGTVSAQAGDWPQILGPNRNGVAEGETLPATLPKTGVPIPWKHAVGSGLAGVAVAEEKVFVFHRVGDEEVLEALAADTGKPLWKHVAVSHYNDSIAGDDGPRCVPVVHKNRIYTYGAEGRLTCLTAEQGKVVWSKPLAEQYKAPLGYFGAGSTPVIDGSRIIANVGGDKAGAGIVALDLETGDEAWKAFSDQPSYSSPIIATVGQSQQVLVITRLHLVSLDPATGKVNDKIPFGARGPTVNGASPVVIGDHLFLTASYNIGAVWARLSTNQIDVVWKSDDILSSQYPTPVVSGGLLYGIDGRQDIGRARLRCLDPQKEKILWSEEGFGMATLILAGDKLLCWKTNGELALVNARSDRFERLGETSICTGSTRALPALSNGRLFVRNESHLYCVDLHARK